MNENPILTILIALMLCLLFGCNQGKEPVRLATYTYSTNDRIENLKPLARELETRLEREVQTTSYPDVESFISGIKSNKVDIALINTLGYLILASDNPHMIPLANMHIDKDAIDIDKETLVICSIELIN